MRQYLSINLAGIILCSTAPKKPLGLVGCERGGIRTPDTVVRSHVL